MWTVTTPNRSWSPDPHGVSEGVMTPRKLLVDLILSCTVGMSDLNSTRSSDSATRWMHSRVQRKLEPGVCKILLKPTCSAGFDAGGCDGLRTAARQLKANWEDTDSKKTARVCGRALPRSAAGVVERSVKWKVQSHVTFSCPLTIHGWYCARSRLTDTPCFKKRTAPLGKSDVQEWCGRKSVRRPVARNPATSGLSSSCRDSMSVGEDPLTATAQKSTVVEQGSRCRRVCEQGTVGS